MVPLYNRLFIEPSLSCSFQQASQQQRSRTIADDLKVASNEKLAKPPHRYENRNNFLFALFEILHQKNKNFIFN